MRKARAVRSGLAIFRRRLRRGYWRGGVLGVVVERGMVVLLAGGIEVPNEVQISLVPVPRVVVTQP